MKRLLTVFPLLSTWLLAAQEAPNYPAAPSARRLVKAEYFFNTDPGQGQGTAIVLSPDVQIANLAATLTLNGPALEPGFHRLYLRTQDDGGRWSLTHFALFDNVAVPAYPAAPGARGVLTEAEYFIDSDPGFGNGIKIETPASEDASSLQVLVNVSGLPAGVHRLYVRAKDVTNRWSLTHYAVFDNAVQTPYPAAPAAAPPIGAVEYYFDTDPGFGQGSPITVPSATDVPLFSFDVPVGSLSPGRHTLFLRSRQNPWSLTAYAELIKGEALPVRWVYVRAEAREGDAFLSWATAMEEHAVSFVVEYSTDGNRYQTAGEVAATNRPSGSSYRFRHVRPGPGVIYYRIKQVDANGAYTYSRVMPLLFREGLQQPLLFPNPATTDVHLVLPRPAASVQPVRILDMGGRVLLRGQAAEGATTVSLSVQELPPGTYLLTMGTDAQMITLSFIKK